MAAAGNAAERSAVAAAAATSAAECTGEQAATAAAAAAVAGATAAMVTRVTGAVRPRRRGCPSSHFANDKPLNSLSEGKNRKNGV